MRELTLQEACLVSGADASAEFNQCMADNWAENTYMGAFSGAVLGGITGAGAFSFPGAVGGGILGGVGGSSATASWCFFTSIF